MIRVLKGQGRSLVAASAVLGLLAASPALAATHKKPAKAARAEKAQDAKPEAKAALSSKPQLVGTYGDWGAYEAQGAKSKICYALAQPKERTPSSLKREQGYIFISTRPGEHVKNEVSVIMGLALKEGSGDAKAEIGTSDFDLVTKGQNAWMKDSAQEGPARRRDEEARPPRREGAEQQGRGGHRFLFADRPRPGAGPRRQGLLLTARMRRGLLSARLGDRRAPPL